MTLFIFLLQATSGISSVFIWSGAIVFFIVILIILGVNKQKEKKKVKYPALRILSTFFEIIAVIILASSAVIAYNHLVNLPQVGDYWEVPLLIAFSGMVLFIVFLSYAEIIKVFLDIEENTRKNNPPN